MGKWSERLDSIMMNKRQCVLTAMIINVLFAGGILFSIPLHYLTGDEYWFNLILSGAEGSGYTEYTTYQNIIWSLGLSKIYQLLPGVNWYVVVSIAFSVISLTGITYCFLRRGKKLYGVFYSVLLLVIIGQYAYAEFAFTYNAYLYCVAGFLLAMDLLWEKSLVDNKGQLVAAFVLSMSGAMVRGSCLYAVAPFFIATVGIYVCKRKRGVKILMLLSIMAVGGWGIGHLNTVVYQNDYEWKEYLKYDEARYRVLDYQLPKYQENIDFYESIGISLTGFQMIQAWMLEDYEVFDTDTLKKIAEYRDEKEEIDKKISDVLIEQMGNFFGNSKIGILVVGLLIWLVVVKRRTYLLELTGISMVFILEYLYLLMGIGILNFRSQYGLWLALAVILSYFVLGETNKKVEDGRRIESWVLLLGGCILGGVCIPGWRTETQTEYYGMENDYEQLLKFIGENKQNLYLTEMWTIDEISKKTDPYNTPKQGSLCNLYAMGGCYLRNPRTDRILERYEVENPIPALAEKENVYLIAKYHVELIDQYLMEVVDDAISYEEIERFGEIGIYRFYVDASMHFEKTGEFYDDGWFGTNGQIHVYNQEESENAVKLRFVADENIAGAELCVKIDGITQTYKVREGENVIELDLKEHENTDIDISIDRFVNQKQQGTGEDIRNLSVYILDITIS